MPATRGLFYSVFNSPIFLIFHSRAETVPVHRGAHLKSIFFAWIVLFSGLARAQSLNDYSLLLPLPDAESVHETMGASTSGPRGALLPKNIIDDMPNIVVGEDKDQLFNERLRVIAVRLDPCFFEGSGPLKCRPQIRMVWQPLLLDRRSSMAQDAAVHTFYDLSESDFAALLRDMKPYRAGDRSQALGIHPGVAMKGYASAYWRGLRSVLLKYAGERSLTRGTFMTVNPMGTVWVFGAFDYVNGRPERILVPRVNFAVQGFFVDTSVLRDFKARMNPFPPNEVALLNFLSDSNASKSQLREEDLQAVVKEAYEFENPARHNPGTLDCVSCHVAQSIRLWGQFHFPAWKTEALFGDVQFKSGLNLRNSSPDPFRADSLRAFGYFGANPVISDRTINETAAVFESLHSGR